MYSYKLFLLLVIFSISPNIRSQDNSDFRPEDRARLKEAFDICNEYGDMLWKGWTKIPYTALFVTDSNEYLINHPSPTSNFVLIGYDSMFQSDMYKRPRKFQTNFLAAFDAVNNISTIVVGNPENTGRSSLMWIISVIHEHFHQLQDAQSDYNSGVKELDLAGNDSTGMWMLNYPFPYEDPAVADQFKVLTAAAQSAAFADEKDFSEKYNIFNAEKKKFKGLLSEKDYRYFSFQLWNEGIAMYTELKVFEMIKDKRQAPAEIQKLSDYISYSDAYQKKLGNIRDVSVKLKLEESKRACFYYIGALEGIILDRINPNWREMYFKKKFNIDEYFIK